MKPILQITNLSLTFTLDYTKNSTLKDAFSSLFTQKDYKYNNEFTALDNISLNFSRGEKVAIIGRNGAGKSTLLKCIANIYQDYSGEIQCNGSIAPLIEIGAGFHPDLTGRENLRLNAAIFGKRKKEIDLLEDSIINFSGIEKFIDIPVKKYSSGMFMRLAFSIATSVSPDILILDESFSAGDEEFNKLAHERMKSTIDTSQLSIMISHDENTLKKFCNRGIVLHEGGIIFDGDIGEALALYKEAKFLKKKHVSDCLVIDDILFDPIYFYFILTTFIANLSAYKLFKKFFLHRRKNNERINLRNIRFTVFMIFLKPFARKNYVKNLNFINDIDYARKYDLNVMKSISTKFVEICKKSTINEFKYNLMFNKKTIPVIIESHTDESIKVAEFNNITVRGKSSLYLDIDRGFFFSFYKNLINHNLSEELRLIKRLDNSSFQFFLNKQPKNLDKAISLMHSCSSNYCHMMIEIIPLINAIKNIDEYKDLPILIDSDLHENIYEIIFSLYPDINMILVKPRVQIIIKHLIYLSTPSFFPFDPSIENDNTLWYSSIGIKNLAEDLKGKYINRKVKQEIKTNKYYLLRGSDYRNVDNENKVVQYCMSRGYEIIDPNSLSVMSQINLFSEASVIISPTGAALTNLVFCNSGARAGILYSDSKLLDLNLWPKLVAATSRIKVSIIKCKSKNTDYMHSDYSISQKDLSDFIDLVEA